VSARRTVAVIQARTGASRLPNKMLLALGGAPIVEWVWRRASSARRLDAVVVAIPEGRGDEALQEALRQLGAEVFRGSERDVLGRFRGAAAAHGATHVVRVCADNPFVDGAEIDRLVEFFLGRELDYAYNHVPKGNRYPDGLGAEIAPMALVERMAREAQAPEEREHVFEFLWRRAAQFRIGTFDPPAALQAPELRLDLDTMDDYTGMLRRRPDIKMTAGEIVALFRKPL